MKVQEFDYKDYEKVFFVGDLHGHFSNFFQKIKSLSNAVIIVCGDIGLGFTQGVYTTSCSFDLMSRVAVENNLQVLLIRGNHDDPKMFTGEEFVSNFRTIPDYSIVIVKYATILCIGGGISIDRMQRRIGTSYWPGETVKGLTVNLFEELRFYKPSICASHISPSCTFPHIDSPILLNWMSVDKNLRWEIDQERNYLQEVYDRFPSIKNWYFGHYHSSFYEFDTDRNTSFYALTIDEIREHEFTD